MKYTAEQYEEMASKMLRGSQAQDMLRQAAALLREQAKGATFGGLHVSGDSSAWEQAKGAQQPVAWGLFAVCDACNGAQYITRVGGNETCWKCDGRGTVYTAPRAAVPFITPEKVIADSMDNCQWGMAGAITFANGWNACRRAMLNAAPSDGGEQGERHE